MRASRKALPLLAALVLAAACTKNFDVFEPSPIEVGVDAGVDGAFDATADVVVRPDAGNCPSVCSGGCDAGTCIVNATGDVTCPPAMACHVRCRGGRDCDPAQITCASGTACFVECSAGNACDTMAIVKNGASKLCLACTAGNACDDIACTGASPCSKVCASGSSCNPSTCGACNTVPTCP